MANQAPPWGPPTVTQNIVPNEPFNPIMPNGIPNNLPFGSQNTAQPVLPGKMPSVSAFKPTNPTSPPSQPNYSPSLNFPSHGNPNSQNRNDSVTNQVPNPFQAPNLGQQNGIQNQESINQQKFLPHLNNPNQQNNQIGPPLPPQPGPPSINGFMSPPTSNQRYPAAVSPPTQIGTNNQPPGSVPQLGSETRDIRSCVQSPLATNSNMGSSGGPPFPTLQPQPTKNDNIPGAPFPPSSFPQMGPPQPTHPSFRPPQPPNPHSPPQPPPPAPHYAAYPPGPHSHRTSPPVDEMQRFTLQPQPPSQASLEGRSVDLLQQRNILPTATEDDVPRVRLPSNLVENPSAKCDPDIFRCTLPAVPNTTDLLKKSRLPLGLILHPFKDMKSLTILQVSVIVRCRACRTYINPFVQFTDNRHWRCNICYRVNDLPDDFSWDPVTKSFGDPQRRPEIRHSTIEFIAPGEYMGQVSLKESIRGTRNIPVPVRKNMEGRNELRPPQPAVYVFILDVSANAIETGYLGSFCAQLLKCLDRIPGDHRTLMSFITVDSGVHFYQFVKGCPQPKQLIVTELDDIFVPCNDGLIINVSENKEVIREFIQTLPSVFDRTSDSHNALGAAVTAAHQLVADIGGRISVMQTILPDVGPGALNSREDPNLRASGDVQNLGPATDFYKRLALECSGHQVAIDLFLLSSQYADLATLSGVSKFCGGCIHHYPNVHLLRNSLELTRYEKDLQRYFTRKIGLESVLRIRCTKGLSLHTFHGNFFVRSTDLLALPNVNPDTALGVQIQMDENLTDVQTVSFQCALLYTSSRGDRRIRVHTMCLPVTNNLSEVQAKADVEAVISLLSKLAVERSIGGSLPDAREALINSVVDAYAAYMHSLHTSQTPPPQSLVAPPGSLRLFPLYILALLKHVAFNHGTSVKLDRRFYAMSLFRTLPIKMLLLELYPHLYPLHTIQQYEEDSGVPRLQLSYERIDRHGLYLMDTGSYLYLYVGKAVSDTLCRDVFNVPCFSQIEEDMSELPELSSPLSERTREFIRKRQTNRSFSSPLRIMREDSPSRELFVSRLIEDKSESSHSYIEFLQYIRKEIGPKK